MGKYEDIVSRLDDFNEVNNIRRDGSFNIDSFSDSEFKIIITSKVFDKINLFLESIKIFNREVGCFLYGKKIDNNIILLSEVSFRDFSSKDGLSIDVSGSNIRELRDKISYSKYDVVCHFHGHPILDDNFSYREYSKQDLYVYAYLNRNFQSILKDMFYIGGLITTGEHDELSFVYFDGDNTFYRIKDLYYYDVYNKKIFIMDQNFNMRKNDIDKRYLLKFNDYL